MYYLKLKRILHIKTVSAGDYFFQYFSSQMHKYVSKKCL